MLQILMVYFHSKAKLTHKQLEMHGYIFSTVATDVLVLKHQAISIHSAEQISIVLDQIQTKILHSQQKVKLNLKMAQLFKG